MTLNTKKGKTLLKNAGFVVKSVVKSNPDDRNQLIYKGSQFVDTSASYPECRRFKSFLSHTRKPRDFKGSRGFSYAFSKYKKIQKMAFIYMVWLSKRLSKVSNKKVVIP